MLMKFFESSYLKNLKNNSFNLCRRSDSSERISPTNEANSVGTWKIIKGKVTQTIEDIKSSKTSNNNPLTNTGKGGTTNDANDPTADSDQENPTIHSSVSDEISLEQEFKMLNKCDSDSDIEMDILLEADVERSRLRRSFANFKSKVKSKSQSQTNIVAPPSSAFQLNVNPTPTLPPTSSAMPINSGKKDSSPTPTTTASSSIRSSFLRKRRKPLPTEQFIEQSSASSIAVLPSTSAPSALASSKSEKKKGIIPGKKEFEIESGVEMLEDMIPPPVNANANANTKSPDKSRHDDDNNSSIKCDKRQEMDLPIKSDTEVFSTRRNSENAKIITTTTICPSDDTEFGKIPHNPNDPLQNDFIKDFQEAIQHIPYVTITALTIVLLTPSIPDFLRGVLVCGLTMSILDCMWQCLKSKFEEYITADGPEKDKFQLPNYSKMPICEIPAVEEHKTVKTYSGWMNEIHNYDPSNFHISMTKSVYVKLDGSILRISNTTARIPKRLMWNEQPIDRKTVSFTRHRTFNLLGCRVEMCPRGLARKRYFSRKYPIQLIVRNSDERKIADDELALLSSIAMSKRSSIIPVNSHNKDDDKKSTITAALDSKNSSCDMKTNKDGKNVPENRDKKNSIESLDDKNGASNAGSGGGGGGGNEETDLDFSSTILNADLQVLQDGSSELDRKDSTTVPCGDETRILLFARADREKEDWYRRFLSASIGAITDQDLHLPNIYMVSDSEIQAAIKATSLLPELASNSKEKEASVTTKSSLTANIDETKSPGSSSSVEIIPSAVDKGPSSSLASPAETKAKTPDLDKTIVEDVPTPTSLTNVASTDTTFEGLLISSCAARNPLEYIRFMALYQNACSQTIIPVYKKPTKSSETKSRRNRRVKRQEDELWKGIDQSLYLGPSGSVVWANVLLGRILFSCLTDAILLEKIQEFLQKKLSAIKLPSFMEDVSITQIYLGETPPLIHRVSQPILDERGTWVDADVTYEGLMHMTITTKLNLLRLKQQKKVVVGSSGIDITGTAGVVINTSSSSPTAPFELINSELCVQQTDQLIDEDLANCAIYDSNAESTGASSSESDSPTVGSIDANATDSQFFNSSPGNARRIFKIVDRITASNLFQYATELSYVQRAMENMSTNITLRVELKGLVSRLAVNIPPPPSDRIWLSFRGPPRLWITAKPALGDHTFDWSIVTNVIESKLCEEVYKYLVYPNMIDVMVPFLGQSTYKE